MNKRSGDALIKGLLTSIKNLADQAQYAISQGQIPPYARNPLAYHIKLSRSLYSAVQNYLTALEDGVNVHGALSELVGVLTQTGFKSSIQEEQKP